MSSGTTTRQQFAQLQHGHKVVPVIRELFADGETPVGIYRKLAAGRPGTFLLESAEQGGIWSRYSFIGVSSFGVLTQTGEVATWQDYGLAAQRALGSDAPTAPLDAIGQLHSRWATPRIAGHPPLIGGLVGFIGWEAIRQIENLPGRPPADFTIPGQALSFVRELVVVDHRTGCVLLIATALNDGTQSEDQQWSDAQRRLDDLQAGLARPAEAFIAQVDLDTPVAATARITPDAFRSAVVRAKDHITAGDVFQVVISQRFDHEVTAAPIDVYRVLRTVNPSPYMYLLSLEDVDGEPYWIIGSSPEALVKVQNHRVYMHPIAGSKPRGASPEADIALSDSLLHDEKERAEHLMLVDLARNDLLKVCRPESVEVTEFMRVERFSHIMHLVSSVEGDLKPESRPLDIFRATFPAGTLSGAPKPRALEIIDELEAAQRGAYGGVVGYFGFSGDLDLAISIRTTTISRGIARVQAGAGVVADSDPDAEQQESRNKAAAPLSAVAVANALRRVG
jgi:anthranilate synthase component I